MITTVLAVHAVAAIAAVAHLLLHYRRPSAAVAWLFALTLLPLLGPLAYAMLAVPGGGPTLRRQRRAAEVRSPRSRAAADIGDGPSAEYPTPAFAALMRRVRAFPVTRGNAVDVLPDADVALREQLAAIRGSEQEVLLATYVLKPGVVQRQLFEALADRAGAGVPVRLLIDPIGSHELEARALENLRSRGVHTHTFLSPNPLRGRLQINFRNHRKILCVDGRLAFTGGRNWSDEYYPGTGSDGVFRDTTVRLRGPVVADIRRVFAEDWSLATEDDALLDAPLRPESAAGDHSVCVQPFGPDEPRSSVADVFGGAFRAARRSIFVATPYFVPGPTLQNALRVAALGGVDVELLLPNRCGKRSIDLTARFYLDSLLDAGVRARLCDPPLLHAKALIVDGCWSSVGSVNFDARSLHLNYELNVEVLGEEFARQLRAFFAADMERARLLDAEAFARRGRWRRTIEKAAALFEPLM